MSNDDLNRVLPTALASEMVDHFRSAGVDLGAISYFRWLRGASASQIPWLQIVEAVEQKPGGLLHYVTAGASRILDHPGYGLEFCFQSLRQSDANIELLAMVAHYHSLPAHRLDVGHTVSIGRPIASGSCLDRLMVSLPYPYGADFEYMHFKDGAHGRILWLLPISSSEEAFRHAYGLEEFELLLETAGIDYLDPYREPVV